MGVDRVEVSPYGIGNGLIDFGRREILPVGELLEELIALLVEDAEVLGCADELRALPELLKDGTSADRQRAVFQESLSYGKEKREALRDVVRHLVEELRRKEVIDGGVQAIRYKRNNRKGG